MLEPIITLQETMQEERSKREAELFIEALRSMSETEKARVQGYMDCLRTVGMLNGERQAHSA